MRNKLFLDENKMKFPSTSSQGNPLGLGSNPSGTSTSQTNSTTITMVNDKEQNPAAIATTTSTPGNPVNGHRMSLAGAGPILSSTPLPSSMGQTSGASTAASMASNFFRRYTSTNSQDGAKQQQQHIELSETPNSNWKNDTTSDIDPGRATETVRQLSDICETSTVVEHKSGTTKKQSNANSERHSMSLKLHKPGKSRKNSRAPAPPQMSQGAGKSSTGRVRSSRLPHESIQRPCQTHSFHTDAAEVQHMEEGLLKLLGDFNSGKLRAFGQGCSMEQMEGIRDQQESLAKLHFDLGGKQDPFAPLSDEGLRSASDNMDKLMNRLERLSMSIGELNPAASAPTTPTTVNSKKSADRHPAR